MHSRDREASKVEKSTGRKNRRHFPSGARLCADYILYTALGSVSPCVCAPAKPWKLGGCAGTERHCSARRLLSHANRKWACRVSRNDTAMDDFNSFQHTETWLCWEQNTGLKLSGILCKHLNRFCCENTEQDRDKATYIPLPSAYK